MNPFQKAKKSASRLRLGLIGPAGSGKTWTSLLVACALGGKVAVIDTEKGSASKYASDFDFDVLELADFAPARYVEAIRAAVEAGYSVVVIDSLSHAWTGKGGALEMHDAAVARQKSKNSFTAWGEVTPHHNALIEAMVQSPLHVIATMRSKTEYVQEKDQNGRTTIRKIGLAPVQRDGMEYEFDLVGDLDIDHTLVITKSRCSALADAVIKKPGVNLAKQLQAWLMDGATIPAPVPTPDYVPKKKVSKTKNNLLTRLQAKDSELAAAGLCNDGDLIKHLEKAGNKAGFGEAIVAWPEQLGMQLAIKEVKAFEAACLQPRLCSEQDMKELDTLFNRLDLPDEERDLFLQERGIKPDEVLTERQARSVIDELKKIIAAAVAMKGREPGEEAEVPY